MKALENIRSVVRIPALLAIILFAPAGQVSAQSEGNGKIEPATNQQSLGRWRDMKFGLFIHWGPVSLKGTEIGWSRGRQVPVEEYDALYKRFNPEKFDAQAWVGLAKEAGMKYLVITSKHHDGFCLWDTKTTDYKITSTPFGRDVLKELSEACRRQGIEFSTYYSICDWRHPDYPRDSPGGKTAKPGADMSRYLPYMKEHLREIITEYGPLGVLWFDGEWEEPWTHQQGLDLYVYVRGLQPDILVNNRVDKGRKGMEGTFKPGQFAGDFATPEQRIGKFDNQMAWESCITICRQWAWKPNDKLKSLDECVRTLVSAVGGDGNLLLNVGPMPDGRIEPRQADRLRQIGGWMKANGESIYATRGGPFKPTAWCASTHKENRIYVHVLDWPQDALVLPPIDKKIVRSRLLGGGEVNVQQTGERITVRVAKQHREPIDTIVVLELDGPAGQIAPVAVNPSP